MKFLNPILSTYRAYTNMARMRRILSVFFRNGLGMFFGRLRHFVSRKERTSAVDGQTLTLQERLRKSLEELGPVYVKVGQMLSTRPDLVGIDFAKELSKLQDHVAPFPFEQVKQVIQEDLGRPIEELYLEFDETPTAAASLAQGHRARLKDGTNVFVKVLRPGAVKEIRSDMNMLVFLADHVHANNPELRFLMLPRVLRHFRDALLEEVSYINEKGNMRRFAQHFADNPGIHVPQAYDGLCSDRVLTMERIDGIKIDQLEAIRQQGNDPVLLTENFAGLMLKQIFTYGFFHADPHPGNVYSLPGNKICYLDFGLCGRITQEERTLFCRFVVSILERNEQHAAQLLLRLCEYEEEPDLDELECVVGEFLDRYFYGPLSQLDVPGALQQLYVVCNRLRIAMRPHIYLMVKALGTVDGFIRILNPDYDLEKQLRPALQEVAFKQFSPQKSLHQRIEDFLDLLDMTSRTPANIRKFTGKLLDGELTFQHEFPQYEDYMRKTTRLHTQRTTAILTVGILINSTLLLAFNLPPKVGEVSLLGAIGLIIGIVMAAYLVIDLLRNS